MFKEILKNLLEVNNLTQYQLSKKADIPLTTISGWKNNNRLPDYNTLKKLTLFFNVSANHLLGIEDEYGKLIINQKEKELPEDELHLLEAYRTFSKGKKKALFDMLEINKEDTAEKNKKTY